MASGITFSGFNNIDFTVVLNAIMDQESRPLTALQARQKAIQATDSAYAQLATKLSTLEAAAEALSSSSTLVRHATSVTDTSALSASAGSDALAGRYEVVVDDLARAQVIVSTSTFPDTSTTIVGDGGMLTIGGVAITISGPVTLQQLASTINASADMPASASIVQTSPGAYRLVLTGKNTGEANAFTIQNALTNTSLAFTDTDGNGTSGDTDTDNTVNASNASILINSIAVTSSSNTIANGIPGVTIELLQKDPAKTVVVTVARDNEDLADRVDAFVSAYNDLAKFAADQAAAGNGAAGTLERDPVLRTLRNQLRNVLTGAHGSGDLTRLSEVGLGFNRTGQLTFDRAVFAQVVAADPTAVESLFADATTGAFASVDDLLNEYVRSGGFVSGARTRLSDELSRLTGRMDDLQARLAVRRASLQREFIAADQAMTRLNSQRSALSSFAVNLTSGI